jgi:hypothetical protein
MFDDWLLRLASECHPLLCRLAAGNIKPSKKKSTDRIDGIVALVMAVGLAAVAPPPCNPNIWVL